tara:strand:+ start:589 stop:1014 length:426 start_codon:yes stop_codon:yes gene_type:complete
MDPQDWLNNHNPNLTSIIDAESVFEQYKYPTNVRQYIRSKWFEMCSENKCNYFKFKPKSYETHVKEKNNTEQVTNTQTDDSSKEFACNYKKTEFYKNMNDNNTKAMDVWANEGVDAAVKHMFTDQETGKQLSYAEMRSRYG